MTKELKKPSKITVKFIDNPDKTKRYWLVTGF